MFNSFQDRMFFSCIISSRHYRTVGVLHKPSEQQKDVSKGRTNAVWFLNVSVTETARRWPGFGYFVQATIYYLYIK